MTEVHYRHQFKFLWLHRTAIVAVLLFLLVPLWLLNVSKIGTKVDGCWQGCAMKQSGDGRFLHILSLNMLHEYPSFTYLPQRLDLIIAEIKRLNIDIALLQEVPNSRQNGDSAAYLAQQTGLNYAYLRANGNRKLIGFEEGSLILSRFPLQNLSFTELAPQAGIFEHRVVLHAVAVTQQGNLDLFVTHLTNGAPEVNGAQMEALQSFVTKTATHTAVIAGDFNAVQSSPQIEQLEAVWIDSFQANQPEALGWTCCVDDLTTSNINILAKRIDYLFLALAEPEVSIQDVQLALDRPFVTPNGSLWASDHIGLYVILEMISGNRFQTLSASMDARKRYSRARLRSAAVARSSSLRCCR